MMNPDSDVLQPRISLLTPPALGNVIFGRLSAASAERKPPPQYSTIRVDLSGTLASMSRSIMHLLRCTAPAMWPAGNHGMTLVDTSVWIDHFEHVDTRLLALVANQSVAMHPFVIGEPAAGSIKNRGTALGELALLPQAPIAKEDEVHRPLESHRLWSTGLGWVDLHLLLALAATDATDYWKRHLIQIAGIVASTFTG